jgi:hypothetical protein
VLQATSKVEHTALCCIIDNDLSGRRSGLLKTVGDDERDRLTEAMNLRALQRRQGPLERQED